jgi:hypothetical protein
MVFKDGVSVDLNQPQGTASYWDYYFSSEQPKGFAAEADDSAGFITK